MFGLESFVGCLLYNFDLFCWVRQYSVVEFLFVLSIFMNGMRFYFKTTSKFVLTLLFLRKKLREFDLA